MSLQRAWVVAVGALVLAGCALRPQHQPFDAEAAARVRSVVVVHAPEQERFASAVAENVPLVAGAPPALAVLQLGILLAAIADAQHKSEQLTAAVAPLQPRLREQLAELLREGLAAQGFDARIVVAPALGKNDGSPIWLRPRSFDELLPWLREQGPADAALVFVLEASVSRDAATQQWCPALLAAARGIDLGSGAALYEDSFGQGCAKPPVDLRFFDGAAEHRFADFDALVADPARVRDGWRAGLRSIADAILADVERRAAR